MATEATKLTSRQRRELESARTVTADVRAYAVGRASDRWSDGAKWVTGIFTALFVFALVVLQSSSSPASSSCTSSTTACDPGEVSR